MNRPEWIDRARIGRDVRLDVGFVIAESFYFGPENDFTREQWQQLREPLYRPGVELYGQYLLSAELDATASELVWYYQDVLRLVARYGQDIKQQPQYFWMRPVIFSRGQFTLTFPWYDTWEEALPLLDALTGSGNGLLLHDLEQGWEFHAFAEGDRLFFRQGNFDSGDELCVVAADRAELSDQVPGVRRRVAGLLRELTTLLGRDYWSQRW